MTSNQSASDGKKMTFRAVDAFAVRLLKRDAASLDELKGALSLAENTVIRGLIWLFKKKKWF